MKTFIIFYENFFRVEAVSDEHSVVHAYAYVFVVNKFSSLQVLSYNIQNVDFNGSAFSAFSRFVVNSSPSYLLSKSSSSSADIRDYDLLPELDFEFENL